MTMRRRDRKSQEVDNVSKISKFMKNGSYSNHSGHSESFTWQSSSEQGLSARLEYNDYVKQRKNGSISRDRDLNNSYIYETPVNSSRLKECNSQDKENSSSFLKQDESPPGTIYKHYTQFSDYWNFFPKTDFTYSPTSRYYGRKIAPGIPIIPNLSRKPLHYGSSSSSSNIAPSQRRYLRRNSSLTRKTVWERVVTTVTTIVTTTVTTVTTSVACVTEPLIHPTKSPWKTFLLLMLLLIPLVYYLLFGSPVLDQNEKSLINRLSFIEEGVCSQIINVFKRPFVYLFETVGDGFSLFVDTIGMLPVFITQTYYTTSGYFISVYYNSPPMSQIVANKAEKTVSVSSNYKIDPQEIKQIVLQVLAEREDKGTDLEINNIKEIIKEVVLEREEKTKKENLDKEYSIESFKKEIIEQVENIEKTLEEQKEEFNTFKPQLQTLEEKLMTPQVQLASQSELLDRNWADDSTTLANARHELVDLVESALYKYHADRTGKTDYALMSNGGMIVGIKCTQTYRKTDAVLTLFNIRFWDVYNTPDIIIKPGMMPGECWAFEGSEGYVIIKLAIPIYITAVTLEHTPKELTHHGHIKSAPKQFSVWALKESTDIDPEFLGRFQFQDSKQSLQTFDTKPSSWPTDLVELKIESNHGHLEYTCIYRFRVHGMPSVQISDETP